MKKRVKSLCALLLAALLCIQSNPMSVYAIVSIVSDYTLETDDSEDGYVVSSGGTLRFADNLTVNHDIWVSGGSDYAVNRLIIPATGTMNGTIYVTGQYDEIENNGMVTSDFELSAGTLTNYGDMSRVTVSESGILFAKDGSSVATLDLRNAGSGMAITDGSLSVGTVYMNAYAFSGDCSDTMMNVSEHFYFYGTTELPEYMKVSVSDTAKITTEGQENIAVYYEGNKYTLPEVALSAVTFSDIYSGTTNKTDVTYADLPVGYQNTESVGVVVSNDGLTDINIRFLQDNEWSRMFSVVVDSAVIDADVSYELEKGGSVEFFVMPKAGLKADKYIGTMQIEFSTAEGVVFDTQTISGTTDVRNIPSIALPDGEYYTLTGIEGKNGFYTSDVVIRPMDGYSIATDPDDTFADGLTFDTTIDEPAFYLLKKSTGQITEKATVPGIKIDKENPVIDGGEEGQTYYADELSVKVSDDNLDSVLVNGEKKEVADRKSEFVLIGEDDAKEYKITAEDLAGNIMALSFIVSPEWRKEGKVPNGKQIQLYKNKKYTLESGTWTVNGDSTKYMGGNSFYVSDDGQYTFNESN